MGDWL